MDAQGSSLPVTRETTLAETVDVAEYAASISLAHRPPSPADCELVDRDMLAGFSSPHTALRTDDQVAVAELGSGDSVRRSEPYDALVGIETPGRSRSRGRRSDWLEETGGVERERCAELSSYCSTADWSGRSAASSQGRRTGASRVGRGRARSRADRVAS